LKTRFTAVAERQDACLELRKNFNDRELSYVCNNAGARSRRVPRLAANLQLPQNRGSMLRSNELAGQLLATGRQQRLDVIVDEVV
jgi:hypothetical protein